MMTSDLTEYDIGGSTILKVSCPWCGKKQTMTLTGKKLQEYKEGKVRYNAGYLAQHAWPTFTADEREFIMTGICPKCWDTME